MSAVVDIPLPSLPRDSCDRVFVTHGGVDVMEVEAVLRSNNQPCQRDHADDADIGMPGINFLALSPFPSHFPNNHQGNVGMPVMPPLVERANQAADLSPALAWGDSKLPKEPILSTDAMAVVANRKDSHGNIIRLNNKESLWR